MLGDGALRPVINGNKTPNVFEYVYGKYLDYLKIKELPSLEGFLDFANKVINNTPAVNPVYLNHGIGVRLANGDVVALGPVEDKADGRMLNTPAIQITGNQNNMGNDLIPAQVVTLAE